MSFRDDLQSGLDDITALGWEEITYDGNPIKASIERGQDRSSLGRGAVAAEMHISVKMADITTTAKDTPVIVDGEAWKIWEKVGGGQLTLRIKLYRGAAVMTRRMH